jgi:hypothetical protein
MRTALENKRIRRKASVLITKYNVETAKKMRKDVAVIERT